MDKKTNQYDKDDFIDVVDENDVPFEAPVPKRWLGTDLLPHGTKKASAKSTDSTPARVVEIPEGVPSEEWTHAQLDKVAADRGVTFPANTTKADKADVLKVPSVTPEPVTGD